MRRGTCRCLGDPVGPTGLSTLPSDDPHAAWCNGRTGLDGWIQMVAGIAGLG